MYDKTHIQGSPFNVRVYDAEQVRVYGLEDGAIGKTFSFNGEAPTLDTAAAANEGGQSDKTDIQNLVNLSRLCNNIDSSFTTAAVTAE